MSRDPLHKGRRVAAALAGAWRLQPPALALTPDELSAIRPLLEETGTAAMVGHRHERLRNSFRMRCLKNAQADVYLAELFTRLQAEGVDPLLVKGWSSARFYGEVGLRPYGDLDLCVPPQHLERAATVVAAFGHPELAVDLHMGLTNAQGVVLDPAPLADLWARSTQVPLNGVPIRVLGLEDHLRVVAMHGLRMGLSRPYWLCDVGAVVEHRGAVLDWDLCLDGAGQRRDWILAMLYLAAELLDARLPGGLDVGAPRWILPAVLRRWGRRLRPFEKDWSRLGPALHDRLRNPLWLLEAWSGPLHAMPRTATLVKRLSMAARVALS